MGLVTDDYLDDGWGFKVGQTPLPIVAWYIQEQRMFPHAVMPRALDGVKLFPPRNAPRTRLCFDLA
jgi:hypothetical protein